MFTPAWLFLALSEDSWLDLLAESTTSVETVCSYTFLREDYGGQKWTGVMRRLAAHGSRLVTPYFNHKFL